MNPATDALNNSSSSEIKINFPNRCYIRYATPEETMVYQLLSCCVNPALSTVGFVANMISIAILKRSGMRKPSNILLFGLVIADSMNLLLTLNFGQMIIQLGPNKKYPRLCGLQYGRELNFFLLISRNVFFFLGNLGQYVCTTIPVLITTERLLAVFLPMTFTKIVNPKTTTASVVFTFVLWSPWILFYMFYFDIYYVEIGGGDYAMFYAMSERLLNISDTFELLNYYVFDSLESWVPIAFVTLGCALVGVKVKVTLNARKRLVGGSAKQRVKWSARTTRTLLSTCFVFSVTHIIYSFLNYSITSTSGVQYGILVEYMNLLYLINSSSNFFVYIASNNKLLKIFLDIICGQ